MKWWVIVAIVLIVLFIIWMLLNMDWGELFDDDATFVEKLKVIGDACCLGNIFKR